MVFFLMHVCAPHVYLVLGAIRRAHVILWAESQETALNCHVGVVT